VLPQCPKLIQDVFHEDVKSAEYGCSIVAIQLHGP
jgi:hypothetical protein